MISRQTLKHRRHLAAPIVAAVWLVIPTRISAVEPLTGPQLGVRTWQTRVDDSNHREIRVERFFDADVPIPVKAGVMMPFVTLRYLDRRQRDHQGFSQDQKFGIGFLHHSPEGDPAWRADISRVGKIHERPATLTRLIANLLKPFPSVKLRPSDEIRSWIGMNYLSRASRQAIIVPEISWQRIGSDGLVLDLIAPKHFYIGLNTGLMTFNLGASQEWLNLQTDSSRDEWILQRAARGSIAISPTQSWLMTASILHDLKAAKPMDSVGAEISVKWTPGL